MPPRSRHGTEWLLPSWDRERPSLHGSGPLPTWKRRGRAVRGGLSGLPGGGGPLGPRAPRWLSSHPAHTEGVRGVCGVLGAHAPLLSAHTWGPTRASCHCVDTGRQSGGPPCRACDEGTGRLRGEGSLSGHGGHSKEPGFYSEPDVLSRDGTKPDLFLRALCRVDGLHWVRGEARGQETCAQAGV